MYMRLDWAPDRCAMRTDHGHAILDHLRSHPYLGLRHDFAMGLEPIAVRLPASQALREEAVAAGT